MAKRILVGLGLTGLFAALLAFGGAFRMTVFSAAAVIAVYEMRQLLNAKGYHAPYMLPAYVFAALHYAVIYLYGLQAITALWLLCVMALAADRIMSRVRTTEETILSAFVLCYPLMPFAAMAGVMAVPDKGAGSVCMLLLFACPLLGDTLALTFGMLFGKHKLCPDISPKKTVEGSVGGFAGGILGGILTWLLQGLWGMSLPIVPMLAVGLICGGIGQVGDLFASALKRWAGVKDYGNLFPGHGGVMDRLDSVLMCAPIVLIYMMVFGIL